MRRVLTSLALIPAVTGVMFFAPYALFWVVVALLAGLCYREYSRLAAAHGFLTSPLAGYAAGALLLAELGRYTPMLPIVLTLVALLLSLRAEPLSKALPSAGAWLLGVFYVFGAWSAALSLRQASPHWIFFAVALNWFGDVAAYYVGRAIGRNKLAPRVSPAKSWEGAVASTVASVVFGLAYLDWALPHVPLWQRALLACAGNIAGQVGDLAESALKRGAGVKDSGTMLPGHGGWLDRLDSSLFSMPTVAALRALLAG